MARIALAVSFVLFCSLDARAAEAKKLRWVTSVYIDAQGNRLRHPEGVACGRDFFVVADTGNSRLLRYGYRNEIATPEAEFPLPQSSPILVQVDSKGKLYFLDSREQEIGILSAAGEKVGELKPKGVPSKKSLVPKSFKIDRDDNLYILDIFSERVIVLDPEGRYTRHLDFPEEYGFFSDLAIDAVGGILLLDGADAAVYHALPKAESFSPLGSGLKEFMNYPTSLATDESGNLYHADQFGSGLAVVGRDGSFLGRVLGMGWIDSRLYYPSQVCISPGGDVLIADRSNSRVQLFSPVGD
jgi:sugar lactone lactonase YvrE